MKKLLLKKFWLVNTLTICASGFAEEFRTIDESLLHALRLEVRTNHPTVAAAQARARAASAAIRAVRLWEDPMAGLSVTAAEAEMRREDGDLGFSAEQTLPRPKLYRAKKSRAEADYSVMQAEVRSSILELETAVAQAVLQLALLDETLAIQTNQLTWLESLAANARERLKNPDGSTAEALRVEAELSQERQRLESARRQRTQVGHELNIALGRLPESAWPSLRLSASPFSTPSSPSEISNLLLANPGLQTLRNRAAAAKAEADIARQERKPIFSLATESRIYSGGNFRETMVGAKMTLPWFNNSAYRANVERAREEQRSAELQIDALERDLHRRALAALTEAESAARQAETYSAEVAPRMQSAAEATENAWISNRATLAEVLEARRSMLNARLEARRFVAAQATALETLRSIVTPETKP